MPRMNRSELADLRGTTKQAMGALLKRNGLGPGPDGLFDSEEVDRILSGDASHGRPDTAVGMTLSEAIRRKEGALARLRELELEMRSGKYVTVDYAVDHLTRIVMILRSIVLQVPTRAVQEISDDAVKRPVFMAATRARKEILRELAGVMHSGPEIALCAACTAKVAKAAAKFQFPKEAFPKGADVKGRTNAEKKN